MQEITSPLERLPARLRDQITAIALDVHKAGGRAVMVGGAVRDALLGLPVKDADVEVFGLDAGTLRRLLRERFFVIEVGASFGVFKLRGTDIDVSLPRRETKSGTGHKGFTVEGDPNMTLREAALRRDFTINALYWDITEARLEDPLSGLPDLHARLLRHCGPRFVEDPLRVLRAMQFIARMDLSPVAETTAVCRTMTMEGLPSERLFEEWKKLLLKGSTISAGLRFLHACGWLACFPELEALVNCRQDREWHPEGDAWTHTLCCMDAYARGLRTGDEYEDTVVGLAVLCHDLGKPLTTFTDESGRIRAFGHEAAGEAPTRTFLARLTRQKQLVEDVVSLVCNHMQPAMFHKQHAGLNAVRRLSTRTRIDRLVRVTRADMRGTPPCPHDETPCDWLLEQAQKLAVEKAAPKPIVMGRHLIELGLPAGPEFRALLDKLYEAQLDGRFHDLEEGLELARRLASDQDSLFR